ncbi:hypothetical protein [Winogradskyella sp. A3E31]|uniref:hypothetical protein n=1 Tax=Winogradskyella sp. A3E31 TaxID=3349637 RepID=UPI00398AF2FE
MIQSRHCDLCEHPKRDLKNGLTCGLTNKKPDFKNTCPDILLDKIFQEKLEDVNLELKRTNELKSKKYGAFYLLITIGFLFIIGNKFYADITLTETFNWKFRASAIGAGITILIYAYFNFNRFRGKLNALESEKSKIDSVLEKYGIEYEMNIEYKEKVHGNQNIEITTEYKNWTKKRTTTTAISHYG